MVRQLVFMLGVLALQPAHAQAEGSQLDLNDPAQRAQLMESIRQFKPEQEEYRVRPRRLDANPDSTGEITAYLEPILLRISAFPYPGKVGERLHGAVILKFEISESGTLMGPWVIKSSGHPVLDKAAIEAVVAAKPFPAFPADLQKLGNIIAVQKTFAFTRIPPSE